MGAIRFAVVACACACALAACTERDVTYAIQVTSQHADEELRIDGTTIDPGGAPGRSVTVSYLFASWTDAMNVTYHVEGYYQGSKTGEYMVVPGWCASTPGSDKETAVLAIDTSGTFGPDCSICADVAGTRIGGDCP